MTRFPIQARPPRAAVGAPLAKPALAAALGIAFTGLAAPAWGQAAPTAVTSPAAHVAAPAAPPSVLAPPQLDGDSPGIPGDLEDETKPAFDITAAALITTPMVTGAAQAPKESKMLRRRGGQLARQDVEPTVPVLHTDTVDLRAGGLLQLHLAPWVGSDSLISNDDPATRAGFRVRRARFGFESVFAGGLGVLIAVNPLETDEDVGTIANAMMTYEAHPSVFVSAGTVKVPFARGALESSRHLISIERALVVNELTPSRRLGVTVEGRVLDGRLGYIAGWLNGTPGFANGNQYGGYVTGARLEVVVFGEADVRARDKTGVVLGGGALYADEPATKGLAYSGDVMASFMGAGLRLEALCDEKEPQDAPVPSPAVSDSVRRCGAYGELSYVLPTLGAIVGVLQPAVRVETYDDNRDLDDAGDVLLVSAGVNADLPRSNGRVQLHYLARRERHGATRANDGVFASFQGSF